MSMQSLYLTVPLAPLAGAIFAGLFGKCMDRAWSHRITILSVAISFFASLLIFQDVMAGHTFNGAVYQWMTSGDTSFEIGFLIDRLTVLMMIVVTFVSLMVHVYTIGYMADDPGYTRFFSYISLFTFSMLMLVMANNFLQLFFGWEAVGLVSYLLIGFWYTRETAIYANLKAFLVNRVGDFGFLLGIGLVLMVFGTLDYGSVFASAPGHAKEMAPIPGVSWNMMTVICILLFIGAMGKSAQFPLHVWLPDSMEGPTPISALIHAATMVTAGIFMVSRMSPLFELSDTALSFVMVIGAITALFMALIAIVQTDVKRVVAYSTLSQLGYMTVALGASAYSVAIFHLMTHAFFKAVLFLGAGSVIIAMHHEQDMRMMGGLRKYMPITYITVLIGAIANAGLPPFAGFFSKDSIIEATALSHLPGATFAYVAILAGVFIGGFYSFRLVFYTFHGEERFRKAHHDDHGHDGHQDEHHDSHEPHESPKVVTVPLLLLAIPSVAAGWFIGPILFEGYFGNSIYISHDHHALSHMAEEFHGVMGMMLHAVTTLPFWLALSGAATAWYLYIKRPDLPAKIKSRFSLTSSILERKYGFDEFNDWFFGGGARGLSRNLWQFGDVRLIDGLVVNGSAKLVGLFSGALRKVQTGYIYHYAFSMIIGVFVLLTLHTWLE